MTPKNEKLAIQLRTVPQQLVLAMSGKDETKQLQRIQERWGIPIAGRLVDLFAVLRAVCEFLDKNGQTLALILEETSASNDDEPLAVGLVKARIAKLQVDTELGRLKFEKENGSVCSREQMHDLLAPLANRIRSAGEQAQRNWGEDGFELFHQIEVATREASALLKAKDRIEVNEPNASTKVATAEKPKKKRKPREITNKRDRTKPKKKTLPKK